MATVARTVDRIVIVTKPTRLEELIAEHLTDGAAKFALESRGRSLEPYRLEHDIYDEALNVIRKGLPNDTQVTWLTREDLPNFLFRDKDLILVCGPDGLFVNLAKYIGHQPVLTVNPDPKSVAGVLMLFKPGDVGDIISKIKEGKQRTEKLPFVKATIEGEDTVVWGINDIFIGRRDHVSARYELSFENRSEHQSSSGIIVSTGVGSTGWLSSIMSMMNGLMFDDDGQHHRLTQLPSASYDELVFVVREPFKSPNTGTSIVTGRITKGNTLTVVSEMPKGGYIFSDGVIEKAVEWNAPSTVTLSVGDRYVERIVA